MLERLFQTRLFSINISTKRSLTKYAWNWMYIYIYIRFVGRGYIECSIEFKIFEIRAKTTKEKGSTTSKHWGRSKSRVCSWNKSESYTLTLSFTQSSSDPYWWNVSLCFFRVRGHSGHWSPRKIYFTMIHIHLYIFIYMHLYNNNNN